MPRPFIHDDFLLHTPAARRLYHEWAKPEPILDFHCHLSPGDIAADRRFGNLAEIWLEGDHYKWRAMRANGVPERFCTGDASPLEKFRAWAATVPNTLRNPLYHWAHLELARYFGITESLNETTADRIWHQANEQLADAKFSTRGILRRFGVKVTCTTDDPADSLDAHVQAAGSGMPTRMLPCFRPDAAFAIHSPAQYAKWLEKLSQSASLTIRNYDDLLSALEKRADDFHGAGCRLSDHGLECCPPTECTAEEARRIFRKGQDGLVPTSGECTAYIGHLLLHLGALYSAKGWTMQLHLGPLRGNNSRLLKLAGPDTGFDSIGDLPQAHSLSRFLDKLDSTNQLPRTVIYNLNPAVNYIVGTMAGNFQDGSVPAKVQMGSGWWFLDQKEGIEWQLNTLSNLGLLSRFIGMVTDSRSFMSFPRHEYFRRVLCNLLGREMESGELPDDLELVGGVVRRICYANAADYLGFNNLDPTAISS